MTTTLLKASSKSNPASIAGAIAARLKEHGVAEVQCIGAGALSQATKAVAVASGYVAPYGIELVCKPVFVDLIVDGNERTAMKLIIEPR